MWCRGSYWAPLPESKYFGYGVVGIIKHHFVNLNILLQFCPISDKVVCLLNTLGDLYYNLCQY